MNELITLVDLVYIFFKAIPFVMSIVGSAIKTLFILATTCFFAYVIILTLLTS